MRSPSHTPRGVTLPRALVWGVLILAVLLSACSADPVSPSNDPSTLAPRGPNAAHLATLW